MMLLIYQQYWLSKREYLIAIMRITTRILSFISQFNANKNYYDVLNLKSQATQKQIKTAFRELAKKYHPDSNQGREEKFKQINQAYQVLSCRTTKKQYDAARKQNTQSKYSSYSQPQQSANTHYSHNARGNSYRSTYRGYEARESWQNPAFRKKMMDELFRQQQNSSYRFRQGPMSQQKFDQTLRKRTHNKSNFHQQYDQMQRNAQKIRITRQQILKATLEEQMRRERQYKNYKDQSARDLEEQMKKKAWKMVEGLKDNVNGAIKVGKYLKSLWNDFNQHKKK